jgi:hypothetical protein
MHANPPRSRQFTIATISKGRAHEQVADYPNALMWFGRAWSIAQTMESPMMLLNSLVGRMRAWRQWNRWEDASEVAREILRHTPSACSIGAAPVYFMRTILAEETPIWNVPVTISSKPWAFSKQFTPYRVLST